MDVVTKNDKLAVAVAGKLTKASEVMSKTFDGMLVKAESGLKEIQKATAAAGEDLIVVMDKLNETQGKLNSIEETYAKKVREAEYDMNMKAKENSEKIFASLLKDKEFEAYPVGTKSSLEKQVSELEAEVDELDKDNAEEIKTAVEAAVDAALEKKDLEFKAEMAEKDATINSQKGLLEASQAQIKSLQETIAAERAARVQEAQARGQNQVTINN